LNHFLKINKKLLLFSLIFIGIIFFTAVIWEKTNIIKNVNEEILNDPKFDILNPSFTINSDNEKISVKANKGNFINKDLILLKKNVSFVSDKFKIYTDEVTFNKIEQTANSNTNSQFISDGTLIKSEGFSILQKGDIILFDGKTSIILNQ
tara:strand:- start:381 stop:830 length:450 start_codon:yes stop_codon:yes gene_type:complete